ncbi:hypothetical protein [Chryseobacterium sp.]|jgi:predicted house-cleaning noncanonical NTP pyrophosphatase (MazG superfamily)|uniref:hypothetical protein n=1 Tax=Chryseobacterium sp. TaxID=1871047 RepID=UPI002846AB2C|nr:hypothetical protein [Chryseobacterium sp.]MDR3026063.1 hypothetical protein [Chryseobacterium sp.]
MKPKNNKIRIYQDSKEIPFLNYKRIVQTGDFYYMVKGYEPGDIIKVDEDVLKLKFKEVEEDYAASINTKNSDVLMYGEIAVVTNEFNKFNILFLFVEQAIKAQELRAKLQELINEFIEDDNEEEAGELEMLLTLSSMEHSEFDSSDIKDLLKDFKVQKSDDLYKQRQHIQNRLDKLNNQLLKLNSQLEKSKESRIDSDSDLDIDEQYISVCIGLEMHVDPKLISLYEFGIMVKSLMKKVDEQNKIANAR